MSDVEFQVLIAATVVAATCLTLGGFELSSWWAARKDRKEIQQTLRARDPKHAVLVRFRDFHKAVVRDTERESVYTALMTNEVERHDKELYHWDGERGSWIKVTI